MQFQPRRHWIKRGDRKKMDDNLTNAEQSKLAECEAAIEHILGSFYEPGGALQKIRDERLYRVTHATFEKYCRERWDMSKAYANRMIEASSVVANLTPIGVIPATESQARELAGLNPEEQRKVWKQAIETDPDGHVTAAHIRETRKALIKSPEQKKLFTLEHYRQAIADHVAAANEHGSLANFHVRQATQLRDEAFQKFGVQIELPFEF